MNAQAIEWLDVGQHEYITKRGSCRLQPSGTNIAMFRNSTDEISALGDSCSLLKDLLSQGIFRDDCVTFPLHNGAIPLRDGSVQDANEGQTRRCSVRLGARKQRSGLVASLAD